MLPSLSSLPLVGAPGVTNPSRNLTSDLSDDLLVEVMAYIANDTIGYMCQTSHRVGDICRDSALWMALCKREGYGAPQPGVPWMYHYARNANPAYATRVDQDLIDAVRDSNLTRVRKLLAVGAEVRARRGAALRLAIARVYVDVVRLMLATGTDVGTLDGALYTASRSGRAEIVRLLLDAGADVHAFVDGALRAASEEGYAEVVRMLLEAGADVHARSDEAMRLASMNGHIEVVQLLRDVGAAPQ